MHFNKTVFESLGEEKTRTLERRREIDENLFKFAQVLARKEKKGAKLGEQVIQGKNTNPRIFFK